MFLKTGLVCRAPDTADCDRVTFEALGLWDVSFRVVCYSTSNPPFDYSLLFT